MKMAIGVVGAAVAASACCIGPVVFSLLGAGALGASAVKLEAYRPWFLGLTLVLVGVASFHAYRPAATGRCSADGGACTPASRRTAKILVLMAAALAVLLITFPYYIRYLM